MKRNSMEGWHHSWYCSVGALVVALALLTACGSTQRVGSTAGGRAAGGGAATLSKREFLKAYTAMKATPIVDARGSVMIDNGQKRVSSSIRWSLVRDQSFVLSVRPMGLVEVGKLTVTRDRLLLLERMGRRAFATEEAGILYQSVQGLTGYNPTILRAIAQHEPFTTQAAGAAVLEGMKLSREGRFYKWEERSKGGAQVVHLFDTSLQLIESRVVLPAQLELTVRYSDMEQLTPDAHYRPVPRRIDIDALLYEAGGSKLQRAVVELSRLSQEPSQEVDTEVPRGYKRLTIQEVVALLKDL